MFNLKVVKVTSSAETEVFKATNDTVIKSLSILFPNNAGMKTVNLYFKESPSSDKAAFLYNKMVSKDGVYLSNIFLGPENVITVECPDLTSGDTLDVIIQYIELT